MYINKLHPDFMPTLEKFFGKGAYADDNQVVNDEDEAVADLFSPAPETMLIVYLKKPGYDMVRMAGCYPNDKPYWVEGDPV